MAVYCTLSIELYFNSYGWIAGGLVLALGLLVQSLLSVSTQHNRWFLLLTLLTAIELALLASLVVNEITPQPSVISDNFLADFGRAFGRLLHYATFTSLLFGASLVVLWWKWKSLPHRVAILVAQLPAALVTGLLSFILLGELTSWWDV